MLEFVEMDKQVKRVPSPFFTGSFCQPGCSSRSSSACSTSARGFPRAAWGSLASSSGVSLPCPR